MKRFHVTEPGLAYAGTIYGRSKREALALYRVLNYPHRQRLPKGTTIWESPL